MIRRDGFCTSLWQADMQPYIATRAADNDHRYDVIIVGGGITGITTGLLLQQRGKKCLILEAASLGFGTTGGTTAHLNTLLDTPYHVISKNFNKDIAQQVAMVTAEALETIKGNCLRYNIQAGWENADAFLFAQDADQEKELEEIRKASTEAGLTADYCTAIPVPVPFTKAIQVKEQAKFNPLPYIYALAEAFEAEGGVIVQDCRVTASDVLETYVEVNTTKGMFRATDLVYATHIPPGINLLHLRCVPYRSYAMAVTLEGNDYPQGLSYDMYDPYHYYRTQEVNGQLYLIAGGEDHKTGMEENTSQCFRRLESHIRQYFKVKEIIYQWSSQYFEPADGLPYIGHLPGYPEHIYVATGFGGNGMTYSTVAALQLTRIIMQEKPVGENLFNPNRIKPVAGFTNFVTHNAAVVKQFLGKLFSADTLSQLAELAPGEGRVVELEEQKMALYKNEEGRLYALRPDCTHMKCDVKWNMAEKSWDCPCHGARYDFEGKILTGPADASLEVINIE